MRPKRIEIIKKIVENVKDEIIVCNIGIPSKELYHLKDRERNFYMLGSMGLASSIGLGLALNVDEKVIVIDGDGSILMNLGSLATISYCKPKNLILVIVDNSAYGSTGNQETSAKVVKLEKIAEACNLNVEKSETLEEFEEIFKKALTKDECFVIVAKAIPYNEKVPNIPLHPVEIKYRFMKSINQ
ncbi:sulfopyruvate decarboxylase subunit beta [Methanocaldococcus infernus]|uniref:sulfopyruvate decarboxylase n=1 Tax=Methanocaldococcus infernus (strain DSM 11812 / JCM 15783 / ME) TaxID=573063 RepID=D5VTG1_METIM|nr:sulfopyruvate decarboxylase subunit beta [Methanocaldococcus infernus]ADG13864.1 thiamine pyrophosphate protein domain protein TPP-binding protein [Methanocaldococcus infernus ME]